MAFHYRRCADCRFFRDEETVELLGDEFGSEVVGRCALRGFETSPDDGCDSFEAETFS